MLWDADRRHHVAKLPPRIWTDLRGAAQILAATEMGPLSKDAFLGPGYLRALSEVYAKAGQHEAALDQLEYLLSIPSGVSVGLLRHDPIWDPLREHPRFERLPEDHAGYRS